MKINDKRQGKDGGYRLKKLDDKVYRQTCERKEYGDALKGKEEINKRRQRR